MRKMATTKYHLAFLFLAFALLFCLAACSDSVTDANYGDLDQDSAEGEVPENDNEVVTWCIAKPSADSDKLRQNMDFSCAQSGVDCKAIQPGGSCFHPDNQVSHASFAMNLYYKAFGKNPWDCHFNGTGIIISENPSVNGCNYPA